MFASFALFILTSILVRGAQAAPTNILSNVLPIQGSIKPGSYIVKVLDTADKGIVIDDLQRRLGTQFTLVHDYDLECMNAFSANVDPSALNTIASNPNIEYISEDGILRTSATQGDAPWGLQRISHPGALPPNSNPNNLAYKYDYSPTFGKGVNVYIVDTGINTNHDNFADTTGEGPRASLGFTAFATNEDGNGHGTHCAGTAVGSLYGVARAAHVVAVKVMSDEGTGSTSDIIAGINWVVNQYRQTGVPAVMSMSIGGLPNLALNQAVDCAVKQGVHAVVAAGNDGRDAALTSPANVPSAITVGAMNITDVKTSFSNDGPFVDIYAPGQNVISSWIGSNTATKNISGTSMATPHVAGVVASWISQKGNCSPSELRDRLRENADHTQSGLHIAQVPAVDISGATDGAAESKAEVAGATE